MSQEIGENVKRDQLSASVAQKAAQARLHQERSYSVTSGFASGIAKAQLNILDHIGREQTSLSAIASFPFHAMALVEIEAAGGKKAVRWYGNENTLTNENLESDGQSVKVLMWTHPAIQVGLSARLGQKVDINRAGYTIRSVKPLQRGRFRKLFPNIVGLYEPGGATPGDGVSRPTTEAGLKSVKLDMTPEQVDAFLHRMDGFMMVTGAPGTGKTTVALQRIRFLFDQQELRDDRRPTVPYAPELTAVFLANSNLMQHSRRLLETELQIPAYVIRLVGDFIAQYLDRVWTQKLNARPIQRRMDEAEARGREAFFNLWTVKDLIGVWQAYEEQVKSRLADAGDSEWAKGSSTSSVKALANALETYRIRRSASPLGSDIRMDTLYQRVRGPYENLRSEMREAQRRSFDSNFAKWCFHVYDPFDTVASYFKKHLYEGSQKVKSGTVQFRSVSETIQEIEDDWKARHYGPQEQSWFAWLLRFVLPERMDPLDRFREMPYALPEANHKTQPRYTQVVIDEAQDLSVQEASLLASLVHPRGSLTVSADFHQIVSPVHAMEDAEALKFGVSITDQDAFMQYPFAMNMRQSWEIGTFLKSFYQKTFGDFPPFDAGDRFHDRKPALYIGRSALFPSLIRQMMKAFSASKEIRRIALLQINDDSVALDLLSKQLKQEGVSVTFSDTQSIEGKLLVTTVEKAKGLEFDACIVIGLDDIERASLNFSKNRAYVAVSRPARRLFILCEHFPPLLQKIDKQLYDRREV